MTCLTDADIQAVADGEAPEGLRTHAESCKGCASRVEQQRRRVAEMIALLASSAAMPQGVAHRVERALADPAAGSSLGKGSTRLRATEASVPRFWRRPLVGVGLAAAAAVVLMFVVPSLNGPGTVSAADVLAQSLQQLEQRTGSGVERREYELVLEGVPREVMPDQQSGRYRIEQVIDHDTPGRFRMSTFASDGTLLSAVSEDPPAHRRTSVFRLDQQVFRFEFEVEKAPRVALSDLERLHNEATVAVMQASVEKQLRIVEDAGGKAYVVEVPPVSAPRQAPLWDLQEARIVIDAADYRIRELFVRGMFLKQAYSISYKLIRRDVRPHDSVPKEELEVPETPGAVVLEGAGTGNPMRDALALSLHELAEARARQ